MIVRMADGSTVHDRSRSWLRSPVQLSLFALAIVALWSPYLVRWKLGLHSDSAVPVLMARHILDGERPLYFWGQPYFGAIDSYLTAGLLALFGRDLVFLSYLPPLLCYALGAVLLVRAAPAAERTPRACLLLLASPGLFLGIARCGLSQDSLLWLGLAAVIALRPGLEDDPCSPLALPRAALAGLALALAVYRIPTSLLAIPVLIALVALALLVERRAQLADVRPRRRARLIQLTAVIAFAQLYRIPELLRGPADLHVSLDVAGVPRRLYLLAMAFLQFDPLASFGVTTSGHYTFYSGLPIAQVGERYASLSARSPWSWFVAASFIALTVAGFVLIARAALRAVRAGQLPDMHGLYFAALLPVLCASIVVQTMFFDTGSLRYLLAVFFPIVVCMAAALARLPRRVLPLLALVWALLVGIGHVRMLALDDAAIADLERANRYLLARRIDAGVADYWLSYVNVLLSDERLRLAPAVSDRYPAYVRHVASKRELAVLEFCPHGSTRGRPRLAPPSVRVLEQRAFGSVCVSLVQRVP
jgi:hypothetical protein